MHCLSRCFSSKIANGLCFGPGSPAAQLPVGDAGDAQQPRRKVRLAITTLGLLASTFLASAPAQAQSARGSLRISFIVENRFELQVDEAAGQVTLKAPGAAMTFPSWASNSLSLDAALAELADTSVEGMAPTGRPVVGVSPLIVNLLIFAK